MEKAKELLTKLRDTVNTLHLDMGGKNTYSLKMKAHPIIKEIENYLYECTDNCKATKLLIRLMKTIHKWHDNSNRYVLSTESHPIIKEIEEYLYLYGE